jgi:hypothetical protein
MRTGNREGTYFDEQADDISCREKNNTFLLVSISCDFVVISHWTYFNKL